MLKVLERAFVRKEKMKDGCLQRESPKDWAGVRLHNQRHFQAQFPGIFLLQPTTIPPSSTNGEGKSDGDFQTFRLDECTY